MKRSSLAAILAIVASVPVIATANSQESPPPASAEAAVKAARSTLGSGYLKPEMIPDSTLLMSAPPEAGSPAFARDEEGAKNAVSLRGSPRWTQATLDAELLSPAATGAMSCAAGLVIGEKQTPAIQKLMRRATADLGMSGRAAKQKYQRPRPFMVNGEPTCTPDWEPMLRKDGSYPSGHSAIGYGWGLILAEVFPYRAAQLVARGRAYGDSRRICNVHWLSDVEEGRITASAVVARLHADPAFQKDLKAAKAEAKKLRSKSAAPDCAAETASLGSAG